MVLVRKYHKLHTIFWIISALYRSDMISELFPFTVISVTTRMNDNSTQETTEYDYLPMGYNKTIIKSRFEVQMFYCQYSHSRYEDGLMAA